MRETGVRLNALSYTAGISAAQRQGDSQLALSLYSEMEAAALPPNALAGGAAVTAQAASLRWQDALSTLARLAAQQVAPRTAAFNEAMRACVAAEQWREAVRLHARMVEGGVRADGTTLALAVEAHGALGEWRAAATLLEQIAAAGYRPPAATLQPALKAALGACRAAKQWRIALEILEGHADRAPSPPVGQQATAIETEAEVGAEAEAKAAAKAAKAEAAELLVVESGVGGVGGGGGGDGLAHGRTHGSGGAGELRGLAMDACVAAGEWQRALELFDSLGASGLVPGQAEWHAALHAFAVGGCWERALHALPSMERAGVFVDHTALGHVAAACASGRRWAELRRLLEVAGRLAPQSFAGGAAETARALLCAALRSCASSEDVDAAMAAAAEVLALGGDGAGAAVELEAEAVMAAVAEGAAEVAAAAFAARRVVVAQELGGAVVGSAIAAHAACGSWARVGELVALVRREQIALEGPRVQVALARATSAKQWELVLELLRLPCVAAGGGRAAGAAAGVDGVAAAAVDGGGVPFQWSRLSMYTALKACHQLGEWRQAVALLCELQPQAERDSAAAGGAGGAAAAEAMAELRRQADAANGGGNGTSGGDGTGGGVARVLCGEVGLDPGCFAYAMNACLTSREAGALEVAAGPLLAAAEAAGCADGAVYGTAMTACVRRGERARAWDLARRARAAGVQLNALECNIALGAAARCGELDGALSLLGEMRRAADPACRPDVGSYDALLPRLADAGRHAEVLEAFDELQAR